MFIVLEANSDPMGGGASYQFINSWKTLEAAQDWINTRINNVPEHLRGWTPNYIITKLVA